MNKKTFENDFMGNPVVGTLGLASYPTVVMVISPHQKHSTNVQVSLFGTYRVMFLQVIATSCAIHIIMFNIWVHLSLFMCSMFHQPRQTLSLQRT